MPAKTTKIILAFTLVLCLCACGSTDRSLALSLCGSYAVTGMYSADLKGETPAVNIIETDAYGRILFTYYGRNVISGKEETAAVICQKTDAEYVYYYEDACYIFSGNGPSDLDELKQQNDWNEPLAPEKMSQRSNSISFDLYIVSDRTLNYTSIRTACGDALGIHEASISEAVFLDVSPGGQELYYIQTEVRKAYLAILSEEYEVSLLEISDTVPTSAEIANFKETAGWERG